MNVAPELKHCHVLLSDPALAIAGIGELRGSDRHVWPIAETVERSENLGNVPGASSTTKSMSW